MPVNADTINEFVKDKIDETNHYVELKKRKFAISGKASELDRTKAGTKAWIEEQKQKAEDVAHKTMNDLGLDPKFTDKDKNKNNDKNNDSNGVDCVGCGLLSCT